MNKRLVVVAIAAMIGFAACGGGSGDGDSASTSPDPAVVADNADVGSEQTSETPDVVDNDNGSVASEGNDVAATSSGSGFAGVFSVDVNDEKFRGTIDECIRDGGSSLVKTVLQTRGSGETADGKPFTMLFGQYEQDLDGDGTQDTTMQLSVEVGRSSIDEPVPPGEIYITGQFNNSASAPTGRMEVDFDSNGIAVGFGDVTDNSGTIGAAGEVLTTVFRIECGA